MALWEILRAQRCARSDDLFARLTAERLNGGRMPRNTIAIQHGAGTFKATAGGTNIVWKCGTQEIHGNACQFTVAEDNAQILISFDGLLTKFENRSDAQTLLDLSDLGGRLTGMLNLYDCSNITGSLADLGGRLTYYLNLSACKNIIGVYSGNSYPTNVNLSNTGLTAADMDQTLINFNAGTTGTGKFTATGMTRTAASDDAVTGLISRGWTVTGLTKSEESV